ncbi:hypothetical protein Y032_0131g1656 [Ancylostoma ceylanicum]|uniref:Uncharacterized protein n=1 Tax=Ancylostoma ceylanicum TaxID=53326 RepID=A0A016T6A1_9BILA|nr:hypothetical protein Y032_0131g1656 [Ancylostoma ceylanicum]
MFSTSYYRSLRAKRAPNRMPYRQTASTAKYENGSTSALHLMISCISVVKEVANQYVYFFRSEILPSVDEAHLHRFNS